MKSIIKILTLILVVGTSNLTNGQIEIDTTNWKLYKDSKLLIKSSRSNSIIQTVELKYADKFESLNLMVFYDFPNEVINRKIQFIIGKNTIDLIEETSNGNKPFYIPKEKINKLIEKYSNEQIAIIYTDNILSNGILVGFLKFTD